MKHFILTGFTLLLAAGSFANPNRDIDEFKVDSTATRGFFIPDTKDIHVRALKDFKTRFGDSTRAAWYSEGNGFSSYFMKDGYSDRVYYNKNGRWKYTLIYFDQDKFPGDLKQIVQSNYREMNIDIVLEVQTNYGSAYMIYLRNKSRIRVIKMDTEGEIETITDLARR